MASVDLATLAIQIKTDGVETAKKRLEDLGTQAGATEVSTERLALSTQGLLSRYGSLAAVLAATSGAFVFAIGKARELETATANLAANTGLAGDALQVVTQRAIELSEASTQSAESILGAAEQLEGLVPALSGNGQAIADVTTQAVLLAEATGQSLPSAVEALGQTLSQFGLGAADAARVTNALVAAAQNGAAEVPALQAAFERVGPAAKRAGVSVEEAAAAAELLANKGLRGREAVGGLTDFFNTLAETGDTRLNPSMVGLSGVLTELAARNLTAAERTELFGENAGRTAELLATSAGAVALLTERITGTNAALEQAEIRMDTLAARSAQLQTAVGNLGAEVGGNFTGYLKESATAGTLLVGMLRDVIDYGEETTDGSKELGEALRGVAFAIGAATQVGAGLFDLLVLMEREVGNLGNLLTGDFRAAWENVGGYWDEYVDRINERKDEVLEAYKAIGDTSALGNLAGKGKDDDALAKPKNVNFDGTLKQLEELSKRAAEQEEEDAQARLEASSRGLAAYIAQLGDQSEEIIKFRVDMAAIEGDVMVEARANTTARMLEIEMEGEQERQEALENLRREYWDTDLESVLAFYEAREEAIENYFTNVSLPNEEERARQLQRVHEERERAIASVIRRGEISNSDFSKLSAVQKSEFLLGVGAKLAGGLVQQNKTAFELQKKFGIVSATIGMITGAGKALEAGFPMGPINAALILAEGAQRISALQSQSFESGGGAGAGGGGGAGGRGGGFNQVDTAPPPQISGAAQGAASETRIFIVGAGATMTEHDVEQLMERIKSLVDQRDFSMVADNSRQAQDIALSLR